MQLKCSVWAWTCTKCPGHAASTPQPSPTAISLWVLDSQHYCNLLSSLSPSQVPVPSLSHQEMQG